MSGRYQVIRSSLYECGKTWCPSSVGSRCVVSALMTCATVGFVLHTNALCFEKDGFDLCPFLHCVVLWC